MERSVYHAIAQNPDTPDDVIKAMSQKAPLAASFGKDAALSHDTISRRMAEMDGISINSAIVQRLAKSLREDRANGQ